MNAQAETLRRSVSFTRVYDAPRELVFDAWTDPRHLARWWGPKGFTNPACRADARAGGEFYIVMRGPDGSDYPMRGRFTEVQRPARLRFTSQALDADDKVLLDVEISVAFEDLGGRTRLTVESMAAGSGPGVERMLAGMEAGWSQSLDKLAECLPALE